MNIVRIITLSGKTERGHLHHVRKQGRRNRSRKMDFLKRIILSKNERVCCVRQRTELCKIELDGLERM